MSDHNFYLFLNNFGFTRLKIVGIGRQYNTFHILLKWAHETVDHDFHGVVAFTAEDIDLVTRERYRTGVTSLRMMEQKTGMFPASLMMHRENVLIKHYNEIIQRLFEAGITEFLYELTYRKKQKLKPTGPQVLDFDHLDACFLVCLVPLILACIVFFFEIFWKKIECKKLKSDQSGEQNHKTARITIHNEPKTEIKKKTEENEKSQKSFSETYKDFQQKVKLTGLDCLKQVREKASHEKLSECFAKKKSSANVPKNINFIQVQPRSVDRLTDIK
jgi:hypothetical protein